MFSIGTFYFQKVLAAFIFSSLTAAKASVAESSSKIVAIPIFLSI